MAKDDPHCSFTDTSFGIGQRADGTIDVFPESELAARIAQRDAQDAAIDHAIEQSEQGFPGDAGVAPDSPLYPAYLAKLNEIEDDNIPEIEPPTENET